ncbi:AI-2E family transporter [Enterococcus sp. AZ103]|uniref:AI-2E family transporter n=1 Tax=Enterococcus sp. AZ103 TaxID=2774628 RepID=UPI003F2985DC
MYQKFIENTTLRRLTVLVSVIIVLFCVREFMTTILLTFIFTLLAVKSVDLIQRWLKLPTFLLTMLLYFIAVFVVYLLVTKYANFLINQVIHTYNTLFDFYQNQSKEAEGVVKYVANYLETHNWQDKLESGASIVFTQLQNAGRLTIAFIMSFLLSFFFMVEKKKTVRFSGSFLTSHFAWYFKDLAYFGSIFIETFGVVIEVQILIAVVNTIVTTIGLGIIGFSQLPTLAIMIFFLSLIPVAGVIFSCVPLTLIAYSTGGIQTVIYVLVLIIVVHCVEAYVLNPQFMSSRTNLPIFFTFVILLISEHFLGLWGLLVGIPIFNFFLEILNVQVPSFKKKTAQK